MQNLVASKGETCCAGKSVSTPKFLRKCGRECGSQRPFRGREVVRELVYNDELPATQWALNSAVECHPHTVEVVGSNPTAPTILQLILRTCGAFARADGRTGSYSIILGLLQNSEASEAKARIPITPGAARLKPCPSRTHLRGDF